jgi:hypothetical protein
VTFNWRCNREDKKGVRPGAALHRVMEGGAAGDKGGGAWPALTWAWRPRAGGTAMGYTGGGLRTRLERGL